MASPFKQQVDYTKAYLDYIWNSFITKALH